MFCNAWLSCDPIHKASPGNPGWKKSCLSQSSLNLLNSYHFSSIIIYWAFSVGLGIGLKLRYKDKDDLIFSSRNLWSCLRPVTLLPQSVKKALSDFTFTFHCHALEKAMVTHSSVLAWRIPGTGEPGGLPSMGSHRVGHNWSDLAAAAEVLVQKEGWHTTGSQQHYWRRPGKASGAEPVGFCRPSRISPNECKESTFLMEEMAHDMSVWGCLTC